jgi:uncharacterized protein (TIGR02598 family)
VGIFGILNTNSGFRSNPVTQHLAIPASMKNQINRSTLSNAVALRNAGFSLVEVVLAVGIMALGVVTILGLLPHGMEMSRKTANEQAETRIVDQLIGEVQAADWTTMSGIVSASSSKVILKYFDDQGLELGAGSGNLDDLVYLARVRLLDNSEIDRGARIPSTSNLANPFLRRVQVEVAVTQDQQFNFDQPPPAIPVRRFTQLIAKTRK